MNAIIEAVSSTWDNFAGRMLIIGGAVGWVPFYMLSMAQAALTN